jgi:xylitol oxidase
MSPWIRPIRPHLPEPAGTNWAGNLTYFAREFIEPRSLEELSQAVTLTSGPLKFLGSRHCFNDVANTSGTMVSLARFEPLTAENLELIIDDSPRRVRAAASTPYGVLAQVLDALGLAVSNFASLPHITIAGAIATGTHGSGDGNLPLIGDVWAFEVLTPQGTVRRAVRDGSGDLPFEAGVHLGLLGALTFVEVMVEDSFHVRQDLYQDLPWDSVFDQFDEITASAYSVSIFTHWNAAAAEQLWLKSRVADDRPDGAEGTFLFGARRATTKLHPLPDTDPIHCTDQLGVPGPSFDRLPHFKMGFTPSKGEELQSEYLIPRENAVDAIKAVLALGDQFRDLLFVSEIRTMAGDDGWLSPSPGDSVGLHFTWKQMEREVFAFLPTLEAALAPFGARPHWGKLHTFEANQITALYPALENFLAIARECDPEGRLRNEYTARVLGY